MDRIYPYEVKIPNTNGDYGHQFIDWLIEQGYYPCADFEVDMHKGERDYVTFYFCDQSVAIMSKLSFQELP